MPESLRFELSAVARPQRIEEGDCALALEALTLATEANMQRLFAAEQALFEAKRHRIEALRKVRGRMRRSALIGRRKSPRPEVREIIVAHRQERTKIHEQMDASVQGIAEFRMLFADQIEDTIAFGYDTLAQEWTERFLQLDMPHEEEPVPEAARVRVEHSRARRAIAAVWTAIRAAVRASVSKGGQLGPVFAHCMRSFQHDMHRLMSAGGGKDVRYGYA